MMTGPMRIPRQSIRYPVWITAKCRSSAGQMADVILSDISVDGCGMTMPSDLLRPGQIVTVKPEILEGLTGKVCWVRGTHAGVKFDRPLYAPVVDHLVRVQLATAPRNTAPRTPYPTRRATQR